MKYLFALVAFLTIMTGCCAHTAKPVTPATVAVVYPLHFHADVAFTPDERKTINQAAELWRHGTEGLAAISVDYDLDFNSVTSLKEHQENDVIIRGDSGMRVFQENGEWDGTLGMAPPWGGLHSRSEGPIRMVLVVDKMTELSVFLSTTVHEFGHTLGLSHVESPYAIMYAHRMRDEDLNHKVCLTQADLTEFCRVNTCGHKAVDMVGCERM